nr:hypothetical protein [uncultured Oscillibacter sp.]
MKKLYEPALLRQQLLWAVICGLLAAVLVPLAVLLLNWATGMGGAAPVVVRQSVLTATGWPWQALLAAELALAFAFGASVGLAVPPMEGAGRAVAVRTTAHLLVSSVLWAGVCAVCGWPAVWYGRLVLLGLYWFAYAVVWLLRYLSWRSELQRIREGLGLAPKPAAGGPFQVRPLRAHLLLAAAVELAVPPLLYLVDAPDVPVLTGIFYPFLMLPFFCLITGWSVGRRFGVSLLYPAACGLLPVPWVFLLYNSSALSQAWTAALFALAGNLLGALSRWRKERGHEA